ncbi:hypothetical protein Hanom_Chr11g01029071 [Helianthus anomalus]
MVVKGEPDDDGGLLPCLATPVVTVALLNSGVGHVVSRCCVGCDAGGCAVDSSNEKTSFIVLVMKSTDCMFVD